MNVREASKLALSSLRTNKLRSALTLLGVIIGIASVITILTLGQALKNSFQESLEAAGANVVTAGVVPKEDEGNDMFMGPGFTQVRDADERMNPEMLQTVRDQLGDDITYTAVGGDTNTVASGTMQYTDALETHEHENSSILGVNPDYIAAEGYQLAAGRMLTDEDVKAGRDVALISDDLVDEFFGGDAEGAVGKTINVTANDSDGEPTLETDLQVVGVLQTPEKEGGLLGFQETLPPAFIPYSAISDLSDEEGAGETFTKVGITVADGADKDAVAEKAQGIFDSYYAGSENFKVKVSDATEGADEFNRVLGMLSAGLAAIGGISLLVGGIGVMNIMLITVTERTREIGVRKALGARRRDIKWQFVIEAMIVCLVGGIIGIMIGAAFGMLGSSLMGSFALPPIAAILISLGFSLAIGLFFGYYPAAKAAKLDPIEALRYE